MRRLSLFSVFFFVMIRRPPRSTLDRSSAASDVYKRQDLERRRPALIDLLGGQPLPDAQVDLAPARIGLRPVSYTHLRAHETVLDLVCRLLLEKKKQNRLQALPSATKQ